MITCLIVDDESKGRENLSNLIAQHCTHLSLQATASGVNDAVNKMHLYKPQLLFLDIEMPDGNGFDVLKRCTDLQFEVIFVTAYDTYALNAIQFSAIDYVLKPINTIHLVDAVQKATKHIALHTENIRLKNLLLNTSQQNQNKRIALPFVDSIEFVEVKNIIRLEADGSYTRFYIINRSHLMVSGSLKEYDEMLTPFGFIRTHQAHLVNRDYIKSFIKSDGGYLSLIDKSTVPISRLRKAEVVQFLRGE